MVGVVNVLGMVESSSVGSLEPEKPRRVNLRVRKLKNRHTKLYIATYKLNTQRVKHFLLVSKGLIQPEVATRAVCITDHFSLLMSVLLYLPQNLGV